jgi:hypothetical protein
MLAACGGGGSSEPAAPATSLAIREAPQAQQVGPDETAVFVVAAQGSGAISYQWLRNGSPIAGETRPRLEVQARADAQADRFSVRITDAAGSITSEPVQFTVREAAEWERWAAAAAGPIGELSRGPDQFVFPNGVAFGFDLFLARPDGTEGATRAAVQGDWDPMFEVRDWAGGIPGATPRAAGPVRVLTYAAQGRLWRLDLRVPQGQEAQPRQMSTQLSRQMCRPHDLFQDRVDPLRSLLVYSLSDPVLGCYALDTARHRIVRLNHQGFEVPIELAPQTRPLFAVYDADGTITGIVARQAAGPVLRLDARDFRSEPALALAAGDIDTLVRPGPGQPWWVFSDGARILSVRVDSPTPWAAQTLAAGAVLPDVQGVARVGGELSLLLWEPPASDTGGGRLRACAVSGCSAGPRELLAAALGFTSLERVPDSEGSERAWFVLGDRTAASTSSSLSVAQVRADGAVNVRLNVANDTWHNPQRRFVGWFGDWLLSRASSASTYGIPMEDGLPDRMLAPTGTFLPQREATRANRFWIDFQSSAGGLELRDADGELLQEVSGAFPVRFEPDWQGLGDELLVTRAGAAGGSDLLGLDPVTGAVRTVYGRLPVDRNGHTARPEPMLGSPRTGHVMLFTARAAQGNYAYSRNVLAAIRVGAPGIRVLVDPDS